mmetsp:Transcript_14361/g.12989  ORF Transcript_14361/g.12989 Transcript_14361/m.12989 type:complete len:981 (+) Transcript_14361:44-2986(+)
MYNQPPNYTGYGPPQPRPSPPNSQPNNKSNNLTTNYPPNYSSNYPPNSFTTTGPPGYSTGPVSAPPSQNTQVPPVLPPQSMSPRPAVQFFSVASGTPVPVTTNNFAPPNYSNVSNLSGPPSSQLNAPPSGPPLGPPSGPPSGPPQAQGPPQSQGYGPPTTGQQANQPFYQNSAPNSMPLSAYGIPESYQQPASSSNAGPADTNAALNADVSIGNNTLPSLAELDASIKCNPQFIRPTVKKLVVSQQLANNSRLPIGLIVQPLAGDKGVENSEVPVVDFGAMGIVRCKRCRTYINPFVVWTDSGRRYRCNICGMTNETPSNYFSHLDSNNRRRDRESRPELSRCSVEFVAPSDYMIRPPQPPVYFFVIDVSYQAYASGMITTAVNAIKDCLSDLQANPRTNIGFLTFDTSIHFYNLKPSLKAPQMLVVSDLSDLVLPLPEDLLANLQDSREIVDALLDSLPTMFSKTTESTGLTTCLGAALMASRRVIEQIGGKLCVFLMSLPALGEGNLKNRENPRVLGTDKEHLLLNPEEPFYKNLAIDLSRLQISVDTFFFSTNYTDISTVSVLSKYTGGSVFFYPGFYSPRDGIKFHRDLSHNLTRSTVFESVFRVRCTRGLRATTFYGNYFIRGNDLLALPNCTSDSVFGMDISYEDQNIGAQVVTIQAALLYTSASGERRIRVHNMLIPVVQSIPEMIESVDLDALVNLLAKQSIEIALKTGFENARNRVNSTCIEIFKALRAVSVGGGIPSYGVRPAAPQEFTIPQSLQLLPLYANALQKSVLIRGGNEIRIDERAYYQQILSNSTISDLKTFLYPSLYSIHDITSDVGLPSDNPDEYNNNDENNITTAGSFHVRLPQKVSLRAENLTSNGIFLLDNSIELIIWIGRSVNPATLTTLFGVSSLDNVDMANLSIQADNSDYSNRINAVIMSLREETSRYMQLHFIREGDGYAEAYFSRFLVEDRANFAGGTLSYMEYYSLVMRSL